MAVEYAMQVVPGRVDAGPLFEPQLCDLTRYLSDLSCIAEGEKVVIVKVAYFADQDSPPETWELVYSLAAQEVRIDATGECVRPLHWGRCKTLHELRSFIDAMLAGMEAVFTQLDIHETESKTQINAARDAVAAFNSHLT